MRTIAIASLLAAGLLATAPPAEARLVSQRVLGINRMCYYSNPAAGSRRRTPALSRRIGAGEPCPVRYSPPEPARVTVPSMAMLTGERIERGLRVCVYEFTGRRYTRAIPLDATCPLTPHFNP